MTDLMTVARLEFLCAARLKWIRLLTAAFALLAIAAAYSAGAAAEMSGADGFERTTMALIPVALILIPLAAIVLGVSGQSVDPGSEPFLFGQPVRRVTVLVGRWIGDAAVLAGTIVVGFGIAGVVVSFGNGVEGLPPFLFFVAASVLLAVIFLSLAATIASATDKRATALGIGTFVWFFFVLLYDGVALSAAGWTSGYLGGRVLFASVLGNPADLIRVLMLSVSGTPRALGAAGESWIRFLGGDVVAWLTAAGVLTFWTVAPLAAAAFVLDRRDL